MELYKINLKIFLKIKSVIIPYILMIGTFIYMGVKCINAYLHDNTNIGTPLLFIADFSLTCVIAMIVFMLISYEYMRRGENSNISEVFYRTPTYTYKYRMLVLLSACVVYALINVILFSIAYMVLRFPTDMREQILYFVAIDVFLMSIGAISIGYMISKVRNLYIGYGIIFLIVILFTPVFDDFARGFYAQYGLDISLFRKWMPLIDPNYMAFPDPLYGTTHEPVRFAAPVLLICVASFIYCKKILNKIIKLLVIGICSLCSIICIYNIVDQGSTLRVKDLGMQFRFAHEEADEPAQFKVSNYDMDFSIGKRLKATVAMDLIDTDKVGETYDFTLWDGYKVLDVKDESGKTLDYERNGYYLSIKSPNKKLSKVTVAYDGYDSIFYSNSTACFLPGFFPYYPKVGKKTILDNSGQYNCIDSYKSHFKVNVSGLDVVSNVPGKDNCFEGDSSNIILLGGIYEIRNVDGRKSLGYPLNGATEDYKYKLENLLPPETNACNNEVIKLLGRSKEYIHEYPSKDKFVIQLPNSLGMSVINQDYFFDDYVLINTSSFVPSFVDKDLKNQHVVDLPYFVQNAAFAYVKNGKRELTNEELDGIFEEIHYAEFYDQKEEIKNLISKHGISKVLPEMVKSMNDNEEMTDLEIIKDVMERLEK